MSDLEFEVIVGYSLGLNIRDDNEWGLPVNSTFFFALFVTSELGLLLFDIGDLSLVYVDVAFLFIYVRDEEDCLIWGFCEGIVA